jgi:hypothetical protein
MLWLYHHPWQVYGITNWLGLVCLLVDDTLWWFSHLLASRISS